MSLYKPKKSPYWHYDFQIQCHRFYGSTGQQEKEPAKSVEAAKRALAARILADEADGMPKGRTRMTLETATDRYWEEIAKWQPSAPTTEYQLENLKRLIGKDILLSNIDDHLAAAIARRRGERSRRAPKKHPKSCRCRKCLLSPSTVNREIELLRRVMYRARDAHKAEIAVIDFKVHVLEEPDAPDRPLTADEEVRLFSECADYLHPIIEFALLTGLRAANIINLDWCQIDMGGRTITVMLKSKKPGGRVHTLPINEPLLVLLVKQGPKAKGPVFTRNGRRIKSITTAWRSARKRAGLEDFRFHDLRHTVGDRLADRGIDVGEIQTFLGHADISTTRRYIHRDQTAKLRAMDVLSGTASNHKKAGEIE